MVKIRELPIPRVIELVSGQVARGAELAGGFAVGSVHEPNDAEGGGLAFIISEAFIKGAATTKASVLVVQAALAEKALAVLSPSVKVCVLSPNAYLGLAKISETVASADPLLDWAPGGTQAVHPSAKVDPSASVGPGAVVGEGASIGARTVLLGNVVVGPGASVGSDCVLFPGVVLYPRTVVGNRVRLHANVVLGADGFGYAQGAAGAVKIWHLGRVVVEDDVEVGAGTTIDRGTIRDTVIERGAKIDNQVQIGHNGRVRAHAILCAQVGLAGNVTVGRGSIIAGKVGIADKVEIGDGALVGAMSGVSKDVKPGDKVMSGWTSKSVREWWRLLALFDRLPTLYDRVKELEKNRD